MKYQSKSPGLIVDLEPVFSSKDVLDHPEWKDASPRGFSVAFSELDKPTNSYVYDTDKDLRLKNDAKRKEQIEAILADCVERDPYFWLYVPAKEVAVPTDQYKKDMEELAALRAERQAKAPASGDSKAKDNEQKAKTV
jgi:hypothetical protein